jgi:formylglycine-generating enzyme required for sulfatase activity
MDKNGVAFGETGSSSRGHPRHSGAGDVPAAGVSFNDAQAYATWLSSRTGQRWRLPTVEEWDFAAGPMAAAHGTQSSGSADDPSVLWLTQFDEQAKASAEEGGPGLKPVGGFGSNQFGVSDMGGNVWEWTSSCNARTTLDDAANLISRVEVCGVRVLEGRHRMPMSAFVQDAKGGGCSMGIPPDNLGFRLVREPGLLERVTGWLQKMLGA